MSADIEFNLNDYNPPSDAEIATWSGSLPVALAGDDISLKERLGRYGICRRKPRTWCSNTVSLKDNRMRTSRASGRRRRRLLKSSEKAVLS